MLMNQFSLSISFMRTFRRARLILIWKIVIAF